MSENIEQANLEELSEILKIRRLKLSELKQKNMDPYETVKFDITSSSEDITGNFEQMEGNKVSIAGRIMSKRDMGKASFCDIQDMVGKIQIFIRIDDVGEEKYEEFKKYDIGDIIGVFGTVFKTRRGEISVKTSEMVLLSKSLKPLPEKWHGLKDTDLRYRQRYLDLIVNPEVKNTFIIRSRIIKEIRNYLDRNGFLEVETPILNVIPGGGAARPFITHHNTLDMDLYLRIAPELYLKRLIVGGLEKVYEIGRLFRNEGISVKHNPEFTSIEMYEAYTDYYGMMALAENLLVHIADSIKGNMLISYQGQEVDLTPPFNRMTMTEAVKKYTGVDFSIVLSDEEAFNLAKEKGLSVKAGTSRGEILNIFFEEFVEEHLINPTFITDYPVEVSPLAKRKAEAPELTERFELFITAREMGNAFSELNDPIDQKERFIKQMKKREEGDEEANMMDEDFVNALEYGMPPAGGMGLGIDRLVMLFTDSPSIRDVLLFPTMRPKETV